MVIDKLSVVGINIDVLTPIKTAQAILRSNLIAESDCLKSLSDNCAPLNEDAIVANIPGCDVESLPESTGFADIFDSKANQSDVSRTFLDRERCILSGMDNL